MRGEIIINKIIITKEAECDYPYLDMDKEFCEEVKAECEDYINYMQQQKMPKLLNCNYFTANYYDNKRKSMLMLFFKKTAVLRKMHIWSIQGICFASEYDEELEWTGQIRFWLESKVEDLPDEPDWVVEYNKKKELERIMEELENGGCQEVV